MRQQDEALREELATATRVLARHGMIGMFGHVSVMTDDPQRYLICPGAGTRKDRCRPSEILKLDLDHEFEPGLPLELYMHAEAHRRRPETIRSLVHVHSPALTSLTALEQIPTELLLIHAAFWPTAVPLWDEAELVRDRTRAEAMIDLLGDEALLLLRWHGAVIVGATLKEALIRTIMAETHAQQLLVALSHGRPLAPVPSEVDRADLYDRVLSPATHEMHWRLESSYVAEPPGAKLS
jgi:ribulose-5-phosphate 4-epimerase/fuculose-1-phosphate aldolase